MEKPISMMNNELDVNFLSSYDDDELEEYIEDNYSELTSKEFNECKKYIFWIVRNNDGPKEIEKKDYLDQRDKIYKKKFEKELSECRRQESDKNFNHKYIYSEGNVNYWHENNGIKSMIDQYYIKNATILFDQETFYHWTPIENMDSIIVNGIMPNSIIKTKELKVKYPEEVSSKTRNWKNNENRNTEDAKRSGYVKYSTEKVRFGDTSNTTHKSWYEEFKNSSFGSWIGIKFIWFLGIKYDKKNHEVSVDDLYPSENIKTIIYIYDEDNFRKAVDKFNLTKYNKFINNFIFISREVFIKEIKTGMVNADILVRRKYGD